MFPYNTIHKLTIQSIRGSLIADLLSLECCLDNHEIRGNKSAYLTKNIEEIEARRVLFSNNSI